MIDPSGPEHAAAEQRWREAMRERVRDVEPRIARAMAARDGRWALFALLRMSKPFQATESQRDGVKRAAAPELAALVNLIAEPNWKGLVKIEEHCGRSYGLFDPFKHGTSGVLELVAQAVGVELSPPPRIEDFRRGRRPG